ncbi:MAG TPA: hypothetical protein PL112_25330 [Candidatus Obscuribacter sp.]|nr:hypothetical protein [Candidatus Obscuribacter sp.]MBK9277747.1 hypothetical protein [Candidatus Obscuribacter sp.]MBL8082128.1 hypothetical protein [Candidatus Obscuribacter sp.]HND70157.1 hypothetical protein [Candidatus Obscuribacter sp.]
MFTLVIAILLLVSGAVFARNAEKKVWNNGICAKYGEPWVHFDNDSQGGRGYKCRDETCWISYKVDVLKKPAP